MSAWEDGANDIAAQFAHGHDERLVDGCSLCIAEYDAAVALSQRLRDGGGDDCCP